MPGFKNKTLFSIDQNQKAKNINLKLYHSIKLCFYHFLKSTSKNN